MYRPEEFGIEARYSGQKTVYTLLYKLLQDFSIYFPFITEEIYQELYHEKKSIHLTEIKELNNNFDKEMKLGDQIVEVIGLARGEKTNHNVSLKTPISLLELEVTKELKNAIECSMRDFKATLFIENIHMSLIDCNYHVKNIELELE